MAARLALVPTLGDSDERAIGSAHPSATAPEPDLGHNLSGNLSGNPPQDPSQENQVGRVVGGRYRLEALIAQGGMGRIYRATQLALRRQVAVKILLPQGTPATQRLATQRFVFEAAAAARMHHPHSVTVLDYGTEGDGTAFLVMELLRGRTLGQLLRHEGRLEVYRALAIAKQTAAALCAAHAHNIVHRDLKPGNLFVSAVPQAARASDGEDFIKVVDFGLAKAATGADEEGLTVTGRFLGSPGYMAPEQIRGEATDHRCDIYALGAILFEMLTGSPAYLRDNVYATMVAQVHEPVPPLTLGLGPRQTSYAAALEALVRRAMAKAPEDRFASMKEMHDALVALFAGPYAGQVPAEGGVQVMHALAHARGDTWVEAPLHRALGRRLVHSEPPPAAVHLLPKVAQTAASSRRLGWRQAVPRSWRQLRAQVRAGLRPLKEHMRTSLIVGGVLLAGLNASALRSTWHELRAARAPIVTSLDSAPQGASVWLGRRQLCQATPCVVPLRRPWLKRHVSLRFVHPDCEEFVATRKLLGQELQVRAVLTPP